MLNSRIHSCVAQWTHLKSSERLCSGLAIVYGEKAWSLPSKPLARWTSHLLPTSLSVRFQRAFAYRTQFEHEAWRRPSPRCSMARWLKLKPCTSLLRRLALGFNPSWPKTLSISRLHLAHQMARWQSPSTQLCETDSTNTLNRKQALTFDLQPNAMVLSLSWSKKLLA